MVPLKWFRNDEICMITFRKNPDVELQDLTAVIYEETYNKIFSSDRFRFTGKYLYRNTGLEDSSRVYLSSIVHYYESKELVIINDESIETGFEKYEDIGIMKIIEGLLFDRFIDSKMPYYSGLTCLLYEGICKALDFEPEDLHFSWNGIYGFKLFS